jgi:hypothetical protein
MVKRCFEGRRKGWVYFKGEDGGRVGGHSVEVEFHLHERKKVCLVKESG